MMKRKISKISSLKQSNSENEKKEPTSSSSIDEDNQISFNVSQTVRKQKQCIELLESFCNYYLKTKDPNLIINSTQSMELMHQIFTNIRYLINESKDQLNSLDILCDNELVLIFVNLFEYCLIGLEVAASKKGNIYEDVLR